VILHTVILDAPSKQRSALYAKVDGSETSVDIASIRDANDDDLPSLVVDFVDDPSIADAYAVLIAAYQLRDTVRPRLG
jgi:hypothetical protein